MSVEFCLTPPCPIHCISIIELLEIIAKMSFIGTHFFIIISKFRYFGKFSQSPMIVALEWLQIDLFRRPFVVCGSKESLNLCSKLSSKYFGVLPKIF